jgi:hypothetical protein
MVSAVGSTTYSGVPTVTDALTAGDYTAMDAPLDTSFLPYVFDHSSRNTIISVQNTGSEEATITLHYVRKADGTEIPGGASCEGSPIVDTIPASGVVYYDLLNLTRNGAASGGTGGTIPCMSTDGTTQPSAGTAGGFNGSVYITATHSIAAAASTHWNKYSTAYTGATSDDTFLYYPQVTRHKNPTTGEWVLWTAMVVQNTQSFPISITVSIQGATGGVTFSDTIPALSNLGYNTRFQGSFSDAMWTNCTDGHQLEPTCWIENELGAPDWTGAATVQVNTPGGTIVGVGHGFYYGVDRARGFTYEGLQPATATTLAVCPRMQDQDATGNKRWSAVIVQNASDAVASVELYLFTQGNATGGLAGADLTLDDGGPGFPIPVGERAGFNTRFDSDYLAASAFDPLGNNWLGSLVVTSDEPILATMSVFRVDASGSPAVDWATDYNCYNVAVP